jgi:hypothetical protein
LCLQIVLLLDNRGVEVLLDRRPSGSKPGKGDNQGRQLVANYVEGLRENPGVPAVIDSYQRNVPPPVLVCVPVKRMDLPVVTQGLGARGSWPARISMADKDIERLDIPGSDRGLESNPEGRSFLPERTKDP